MANRDAPFPVPPDLPVENVERPRTFPARSAHIRSPPTSNCLVRTSAQRRALL